LQVEKKCKHEYMQMEFHLLGSKAWQNLNSKIQYEKVLIDTPLKINKGQLLLKYS